MVGRRAAVFAFLRAAVDDVTERVAIDRHAHVPGRFFGWRLHRPAGGVSRCPAIGGRGGGGRECACRRAGFPVAAPRRAPRSRRCSKSRRVRVYQDCRRGGLRVQSADGFADLRCGDARSGPDDAAAPVTLVRPLRQTTPLIFASAHSGRDYPADFIASARLDPLTLRRSEDSFVDELFGDAPAHGAPLLAATFPRAFCDPNREPGNSIRGCSRSTFRPGSTRQRARRRRARDDRPGRRLGRVDLSRASCVSPRRKRACGALAAVS